MECNQRLVVHESKAVFYADKRNSGSVINHRIINILERCHRSNDLETHLTVYKLSRRIEWNENGALMLMLIETHKYLQQQQKHWWDDVFAINPSRIDKKATAIY